MAARTFLPALLLVLALMTYRSALVQYTSAARLKPGSSYVPSLDDEKSPADADPPNPCGHFDSDDPLDAGNAHQPCYGPDGEVWYCCLAGSTMCSCPTAVIESDAAKEFGCYNYVADNALNAKTGSECGYFFPEIIGYAGRMLATNTTGHMCPPQDMAGFVLGSGSTPDCPTSGNLVCFYPIASFSCTYDASGGALTMDNNSGLCFPSAPACTPA